MLKTENQLTCLFFTKNTKTNQPTKRKHHYFVSNLNKNGSLGIMSKMLAMIFRFNPFKKRSTL